MEETGVPILFCEWLKRRRHQLDLTQEELAQRAGCSVFALRKIEAGSRRPSKQLAGLLAQSLELPPEEHPTFIRLARVQELQHKPWSHSLIPSSKQPIAEVMHQDSPTIAITSAGDDLVLDVRSQLIQQTYCPAAFVI